MVSLQDLSAMPEGSRTTVFVSNFAELLAANSSGASIVCTQDIVATSQILLQGSTTLTASKITKDFAGDALIADSTTPGRGISLHIDELTTSATGEGRLLYLQQDKVHIGGKTGRYLGIGVWRPYNTTQRSCVEVSGSSVTSYITGGLPDGDAGDLYHISGGSGHYGKVVDGVANDDCVAVLPRASTALSINDVRIEMSGCTSYRSRLFAMGVPDTPDFDSYAGTVTNVTADVEGLAYTIGSIAVANRGGVMVLNRVGHATSAVSGFNITANVVCNPLYAEYGLRAMYCENGTVHLTASGYSTIASLLVSTENVTVEVA